MDSRKLTLDLACDIAQTGILYQEVTRFCRELGLPERLTKRLNVAVEELFTNIVKYGYEKSDTRRRIAITLDAGRHEKRVSLRIEDDGRPFDPTRAEAPASRCPIDEEKIGGLGIHLCRKLVDEMTYRREGGRNIVTLALKLDHMPVPEK